MDILYGSDQNMCEIEDHDMSDILDNDIFQSPPTMNSDYMDNDWLNSLFEDPVLNDKMITDAIQSPRIQSEHSYSMNNENDSISPLGLAHIEDLDIDFTLTNEALDLSTKNDHMTIDVKCEPVDSSDPLLTCTSTSTMVSRSCSVNRQIIFATPTPSKIRSECSLLPKITIKQEPIQNVEFNLDQTVNFDSIMLPPTPPSSASSDSEGSQSPHRSAPSSPNQHSLTPSRQCHITSPSSFSSKPYSPPLFTNPVSIGIPDPDDEIPQSGYLILSEEEKRTLMTEGFPVPNKLPLTKQEEKNLKKIRRKIKNKISAQESRKKKKEYLETLEKRVESFSQENNDLKKKVDSLENNNRSLVGQLQKLQSIVNRIRPSVGASQTGTVLMVLVLCFAVFLGSSTPSLNFSYSPSSSVEDGFFFSNPRVINPSPLMGPAAAKAKVDVYSTPNMKSRVLLSMRDDQEDATSYEPYGPDIPGGSNKYYEEVQKDVDDTLEKFTDPRIVDVLVNVKDRFEDSISRINESGVVESPIQVVMMEHRVAMANNTDVDPAEYQASMHPDIMANAPAILSREPLHSTEMGKA